MDQALVLREVNPEEYDELIERLKEYLPSSAISHGILAVGLKYGILAKYNGKVYIPNQRNLPLFVVITNFLSQQAVAEVQKLICCFWDVNEISSDVAGSLLKTLPGFDWTGQFCLWGASNDLNQTMSRLILSPDGLAKGKGFETTVLAHAFILTYSDADEPKIENDDIVLKNLSKSHSKTVYTHVQETRPVTIEELDFILERLPSSGAFCNPNKKISSDCTDVDSPMAWCLIKNVGDIGMTFTHEAFRRRGLATCVTLDMVKKVKNMNIFPFVLVGVDNEASLKMHEKIGFKIMSDSIRWSLYCPISESDH